MTDEIVLDCEVYKNYFLAVFQNEAGRSYEVGCHNGVTFGNPKHIRKILDKHTLVTFNGEAYDLPVLSAFVAGWGTQKVKQLSDTIIHEQVKPWNLKAIYPKLTIMKHNQIDLIGATPLQASLKTYGCRIHSERLQDLPIDPMVEVTAEQAEILLRYCRDADCRVTWDIYRYLKPQIELRETMTRDYGVDLRSRSDAQMAEAVIRHKMYEAGLDVTKRTDPVGVWHYKAPDYIRFNDEGLSRALELATSVSYKVVNGKPVVPPILGDAIHYDGATYKMGIGGLHSQEKAQVVHQKPDHTFGDWDVASLYPSIILNERYYPQHLGERFLDVYQDIVDTRLEAKRLGNKVVNDSLKLTINSSYGKMGSQYSYLYSPETLVSTTMTGQLCLLMLIEMLTEAGAKVTSANTDGLNVQYPNALAKQVLAAKTLWEETCNLVLEWTPFKAMYAANVNNYIGVQPDGNIKAKGAYAATGINRGYSNEVCINAIKAYLLDGVPLETTIQSCHDVRAFLTMRGVRGGAVWKGQELGRVVRWYVAIDGEMIRYTTNGNKVAGSDGAYPMMDLCRELPGNLDLGFYAKRAIKLLGNLGVEYGDVPVQSELF